MKVFQWHTIAVDFLHVHICSNYFTTIRFEVGDKIDHTKQTVVGESDDKRLYFWVWYA